MKEANHEIKRRNFIKRTGLGLGGIFITSSVWPFSNLSAGNFQKKQGKLGIALVGLGNYSTNQLAPALKETENCRLAGIVTGTPSKIDSWKKKYSIADKNIYTYENFDEIAENDDIDIVYIVLPNSMHAEYTIRAARAKKNVICEKPMATNVEDARRMLDACNENGVQLAIGYRLHFEPFNKRIMELGQEQVFGKVESITANDSSDLTSNKPNVWRLDKELSGGGPLMDLGIYAVQGAIYTLGKQPVAVSANYGEVTKPLYFHDVEQSINWELEFEDGVRAKSNSSYAEEQNELSAQAENGWWKLSPAYAYEGKKGETSEGKMDYPNIYEQVKQMDSQAASFAKNEKSIVPGEMGLRDMKVLMAIYESADNGGKRVVIQY